MQNDDEVSSYWSRLSTGTADLPLLFEFLDECENEAVAELCEFEAFMNSLNNECS